MRLNVASCAARTARDALLGAMATSTFPSLLSRVILHPHPKEVA